MAGRGGLRLNVADPMRTPQAQVCAHLAGTNGSTNCGRLNLSEFGKFAAANPAVLAAIASALAALAALIVSPLSLTIP
jgi:hypothetical protein